MISTTAVRSRAADARPGASIASALNALATPHRVYGVRALRVALGVNVLGLYLLHYSQRLLLWGPDGVWPHDEFRRLTGELRNFSLYQLSQSALWFEAVFHLSIVCTVLFVLGWRYRLTAPLTFVALWSLNIRNPFITDGGDNITRLVLFYMLFVVGQEAAVRSSVMRPAKRGAAALSRRKLHPFAGVLHNCAVFLIVLQLVVMYAISALHKVTGRLWQDGVALYYIAQVQDFSWSSWFADLMANPYLVTAATYTIVAWQLGFGLAILHPRLRYLAVALGIAVHLGIGVVMHLMAFSWAMLSIYFVLFSDADYRWLLHKVRLARRRVGVVVLVDTDCSVCRGVARAFKVVDAAGLVSIRSLRDPAVRRFHGLSLAECVQRMAVCERGKRTWWGAEGMQQVAARTLLFPLSLVIWVGRRLGVAGKAYDWVASRRPCRTAEDCRLVPEEGGREHSAL